MTVFRSQIERFGLDFSQTSQSRSSSVHVFWLRTFQGTLQKSSKKRIFWPKLDPQRGPKVGFWPKIGSKTAPKEPGISQGIPSMSTFWARVPVRGPLQKSSKKRIFWPKLDPPKGSKSGFLTHFWVKNGSKGAGNFSRNSLSVYVLDEGTREGTSPKSPPKRGLLAKLDPQRGPKVDFWAKTGSKGAPEEPGISQEIPYLSVFWSLGAFAKKFCKSFEIQKPSLLRLCSKTQAWQDSSKTLKNVDFWGFLVGSSLKSLNSGLKALSQETQTKRGSVPLFRRERIDKF